ncbi:MAG TPA: alpha/beta fold hydrolase [Gemmatales bacterium]|nr:alpha/beta fold hydrolase [Gemmatales bacterium]
MLSVIWTPTYTGTPPHYRQMPLVVGPQDRLMIHCWEPTSRLPSAPVVLLLHGIGMHGAPYGAVAREFTDRGLVLLAPDLRGHGQSTGLRGSLPEVEVFQADLLRILDFIAAEWPGAPVVLMGESMGGLLAATLAVDAQSRLAGLALLVPAFQVHRSRFMAPVSVSRLFTQGLIPIVADCHLTPATRDPRFVESRLKDPLTLQEVNPAYLLRLFWLSQRWPASARQLQLPLFVGLAEKDCIVDNAAAQRVLEKASSPIKDLRLWPEAYHTVFWDPVLPTLMTDFDVWLKQRVCR